MQGITKVKSNTLEQLRKLGQSPWYDNIERRLIKNGQLKALFDSGILGITSNPTIFEKAVNSSTEYDAQIHALAEEEKTPEEIYDELTARDVIDAATLLEDTFKNSGRVDGYVSIEVLPRYAHDVEKTVGYAKKIFHKIGRENVLIKVPGTRVCLSAIRTLIREGININVTLLFSVRQYEAIANAYIEALCDRLNDGKDISTVNSVASIFVSRVDTKIDKMLDELAQKESSPRKKTVIESLRGRIAVANAKMIYQRFKEIFSDTNFKKLSSKGAHIQRVLWASTSTKNPVYSDVKYVEELIGENSINTMPPEALFAFQDHGRVGLTIEDRLDQAKRELNKLKKVGIDLETICQELQDDGVKAFADSFDKLINSIKAKI